MDMNCYNSLDKVVEALASDSINAPAQTARDLKSIFKQMKECHPLGENRVKLTAPLKTLKNRRKNARLRVGKKSSIAFSRWERMTLLTPEMISLILESPKRPLRRNQYVDVLLAMASIFIFEFPLRLSTVYQIEEQDIIFPLESNDVYTVYRFVNRKNSHRG